MYRSAYRCIRKVSEVALSTSLAALMLGPLAKATQSELKEKAGTPAAPVGRNGSTRGWATATGEEPTLGVRSIFLNGVDISSARNKDLKNVDIHIDESGNLFISAPHYQVIEEDAYVPLSKYAQSPAAPEHKPAEARVSTVKPVQQVESLPLPKPKDLSESPVTPKTEAKVDAPAAGSALPTKHSDAP